MQVELGPPTTMRIDTTRKLALAQSIILQEVKDMYARRLQFSSTASKQFHFPSRALHPPGCHTRSLDTRKQEASLLVFVGLGSEQIKRSVKAALRKQFWREKKKTKAIQNRIIKTRKR